jgi:hypothetical protein
MNCSPRPQCWHQRGRHPVAFCAQRNRRAAPAIAAAGSAADGGARVSQQKTPSGKDGVQMEAEGIEPDGNIQKSPENSYVSTSGAPKALPTLCPPVVADADLRAIVEAWPNVPSAMRAGIVAMVKAAKGGA